MKKDPLILLRDYLLAGGLFSSGELDGIRAEVEAEVEEAFAFARAGAHPKTEELERYVFA